MRINRPCKTKTRCIDWEDIGIGDAYINNFGAVMLRISDEYEICLKPACNYHSEKFDPEDRSCGYKGALFYFDNSDKQTYPVEILGFMESIDEITCINP